MRRWLADDLYRELIDIRARAPERIEQAMRQRRRRGQLAPDGKLVIVAADHPARGVLRAGEDPWAMADRWDFLQRLVRVLAVAGVDGVLGTADVLEELALLRDLVVERGGPDFLADKVLIGSLNRGGLSGAVWELDDPPTGYTPEGAQRAGLEGLKLLLRVDLRDRDSLRTLEHAAQAVEQIGRHGLHAFIEPLPVQRGDSGRPEVIRTAEALTPLVGVASALGSTSMRTWLKLPIVADFARVARATTCPVLLLGGESVRDPEAFLDAVATTLGAAPNVRGVMIGRNVLYPAAGWEPETVAARLVALVRGEGV
ncbi:MAG TPA: deoxyribose-phosphate aldolase [Calditerricola sp.]